MIPNKLAFVVVKFFVDMANNLCKVLIATDNHLGFMEKDPIRGNDSFESFEEILKIAKDKDVSIFEMLHLLCTDFKFVG